MPKTLTITELSRGLADYINRVFYRGESFIVTRGNKPIAEVRPPTKVAKLSDLADFFSNSPHLYPDDAEQFAKDIEDARNSVPVEEYDPWER